MGAVKSSGNDFQSFRLIGGRGVTKLNIGPLKNCQSLLMIQTCEYIYIYTCHFVHRPFLIMRSDYDALFLSWGKVERERESRGTKDDK